METIICNLYRDSDQAKLYFNSVFNAEESQEDILEDYEKKLSRCFAFSNPNSPDMKAGRKIVSEVEKLASPKIALSVILRFVEMGADFTNTYGDINESFYNTLLSAFSRFVNVLNAQDTDDLYDLHRNLSPLTAACFQCFCFIFERCFQAVSILGMNLLMEKRCEMH